MDFISGGDSASADGSAQGLVARGMTPPKGAYGSLGSEGTDHGSLKDAVGQPFDLAEVSTIFLEFMLMYRKAARLDRESSLEGQVKELLNAADKTREAAAKDFDKALAQGIASIVGGAIQGVVGTLQFKTLSNMKTNIAARSTEFEPQMPSAAGNPRNATRLSDTLEIEMTGPANAGNRASSKASPDMLDQIKAAELNAPSGSRTSNRLEVNLDRDKKVLEDLFSHLTSKSQTLGAFGQALRGFGDGGASIFVAYQERDAGVKRAEGQVHEANAKKAEASYSASSEQAQTAREAFNKVLDMVAEIDRSRSETSKSIARI